MDATHVGSARPDRADRVLSRRRRGFTLVELLIVISIIAVLMSLLLPVLRGAREAGQHVTCLSNLRQIAIGWSTYLNEYRFFPTHESPYEDEDTGQTGIQHLPLERGWGGVYAGEDFQTAYGNATDAGGYPLRVINPYLGYPRLVQEHIEFFLCPSDTGMKRWNTGESIHVGEETWFEDATTLQQYRGTMYARWGTSYRANDHIWSPIGNWSGYYRNGNRYEPIIEDSQKPADVFRPSHFPVVFDHAGYLILRASEESRVVGDGIAYGWWHKQESANLSFLDGSARAAPMHPNSAANEDWSFWVDQRAQDVDEDWLMGFFSYR